MLITLLLPTSGRRACSATTSCATRARCGSASATSSAATAASTSGSPALDNLRYFAELYGVPASEQRTRIEEVLELVGLAGREHERVEGYSRGMRQRLHIARGLLHDPPVVFLDEPTIGVDPVGARELRATIAGLADAGKTVLLTTHYMFEADALCDRIAVIARGGSSPRARRASLKARVADRTVVEIEAFGVDDGEVDALRALPGVDSVSVEEREQAQVLLVQSPAGWSSRRRCSRSSTARGSAASSRASRRSRTPTWRSSARRDERCARPPHLASGWLLPAARPTRLALVPAHWPCSSR